MSALEDAITEAYETIGERPELLTAIDQILDDHRASASRVAFEQAGARDFLGLERDAIPLYESALDLGLSGTERIQCLIQLASSLRNVGEAGRAVPLLQQALIDAEQDDQRDWAHAFLALALHSAGEPDQALAGLLHAFAAHMSRYRGAIDYYVNELRQQSTDLSTE